MKNGETRFRDETDIRVLERYRPGGWRAKYSLRALLIIILAMSLGLGWKTAAPRRQMAAVKALRAMGADVVIHRRAPANGPLSSVATALGMVPQSIVVTFMEEQLHCGTADRGGVGTCRIITDDDVLLLGDVYDTDKVVLSSDHISRKALNALSRLPKLRCLVLMGSRIKDRDLVDLEQCPQLIELGLFLRSIGRVGLEQISRMHRLRLLCLHPVEANDDGVLQLAALTNLQELLIYGDGTDSNTATRLASALPNCRVIIETMGLQMIEE